VFEGASLSFSELNERSNRWANSFNDLGLNKGERVGILMLNRSEFLEAFFGLAKIGAILVPLNVRLAPPELEAVCRGSAMRSLIFDTDFTQVVETIQPNLHVRDYVSIGKDSPGWAKNEDFIGQYADDEPKIVGGGNDPAVILYTSGTSGYPCSVVRDHLSFLWLSAGLMATSDYPSEERALVSVPLYHGWGLNFVVTAVHRGGTTILMSAFEALHALETIRQEKVSAMLVVPRMLQQLELVPSFETYLNSLRTLETFQALPRELEKWLKQGITVRHGYGLTEAGYVTITSSADAANPNSEGQPLFCTEVRIVNDDGADAPPGEVGEILVKGPTVMKEYWGDREATYQAIMGGWLHTGDLGKLGEDDLLYVAGRKKDLIKSGGESIYPAEVEKVLSLHREVLDVAVVGRRDAVWGERVCAIIRFKEGTSVTLKDMVAFCDGKIAPYKMPKELILTKTPLPRDSNGKLLRSVLRDRLNGDGESVLRHFLEEPMSSVKATS